MTGSIFHCKHNNSDKGKDGEYKYGCSHHNNYGKICIVDPFDGLYKDCPILRCELLDVPKDAP